MTLGSSWSMAKSSSTSRHSSFAPCPPQRWLSRLGSTSRVLRPIHGRPRSQSRVVAPSSRHHRPLVILSWPLCNIAATSSQNVEKLNSWRILCQTTAIGPSSRSDVEDRTHINWKSTRYKLTDYFGEDRELASITAGDADRWRTQIAAAHAPATLANHVKFAKHFFRHAMRRRIIPENPFAELRGASQANAER